MIDFSTAPNSVYSIFFVVFVVAQIFYFIMFVMDLYFFTLPTNWVDDREAPPALDEDHPFVILFYPVLRELEATMRTTMLSLGRIDYPSSRYRIVAIPNSDDAPTIASLKRLQTDFPFLDILQVPSTKDPSWNVVWQAWDANPKAYWWHRGKYAGVRDLPSKKTRQLIYAFYHVAEQFSGERNMLINYIDADSCPPRDHFLSAAKGIRHYDVLQAQNVAGNLNDSFAASFHAFDHMNWDGNKYPHLSSDGRQPYWVLGKGLFFKARDLTELGGFHPWITIEDPEVGLRFWANGKRLGIIRGSLVEEVPTTFREGFSQRRRWVCGFFQTLNRPLAELEMSPWRRFQSWMIFLPCLSMWVNTIGFPTGVWALWNFIRHTNPLPTWTVVLSLVNILALIVSLVFLYSKTWARTKLVLDKRSERVAYMLRINPLFAMIWWLIWIVPLLQGFMMFMTNGGLTWQRTEKIDANHELVRHHINDPSRVPPADAPASPIRPEEIA